MVYGEDGGESKQPVVFKHTEEMVSWRNINQEEINDVWKQLAVKLEEEVLENTKWRSAKEEPTEEE